MKRKKFKLDWQPTDIFAVEAVNEPHHYRALRILKAMGEHELVSEPQDPERTSLLMREYDKDGNCVVLVASFVPPTQAELDSRVYEGSGWSVILFKGPSMMAGLIRERAQKLFDLLSGKETQK